MNGNITHKLRSTSSTWSIFLKQSLMMIKQGNAFESEQFSNYSNVSMMEMSQYL